MSVPLCQDSGVILLAHVALWGRERMCPRTRCQECVYLGLPTSFPWTMGKARAAEAAAGGEKVPSEGEPPQDAGGRL